MKVLAIARNTFRESVRSKILYTLLVFALGILLTSVIVPPLTVGDPVKIIEDLGLSAISFFSVLIAILVGVHLVSQEIRTRTLYTLLAKPVSRPQFLLGKFLGLLLTVGVNIALLGAVFLCLCAAFGSLRPALLLPIAMTLLESAIVIGIALLFSSFSTPITSSVFSLALFLVGRTSWGLRLLEGRLRAPWQKHLCEFAYYVLPELRKFDLKTEVVHGLPIPGHALPWAAAYAVFYAAALLALASVIFARRDFK